jgi:hypothetical protein
MIDQLNNIGSQVWAVVLICLGVGVIALAIFFKPADIRAALFSTGNGLVMVGAAIFQHQPKENPTENSSSTALRGK